MLRQFSFLSSQERDLARPRSPQYANVARVRIAAVRTRVNACCGARPRSPQKAFSRVVALRMCAIARPRSPQQASMRVFARRRCAKLRDHMARGRPILRMFAVRTRAKMDFAAPAAVRFRARAHCEHARKWLSGARPRSPPKAFARVFEARMCEHAGSKGMFPPVGIARSVPESVGLDTWLHAILGARKIAPFAPPFAKGKHARRNVF